MENKLNEVKSFIIKQRDKDSFQIAGFYIEFLMKKFNLTKNEALEIVKQLIEENIVELIEEGSCSNCNNMTINNYCEICEEEVETKLNYYKVIKVTM